MLVITPNCARGKPLSLFAKDSQLVKQWRPLAAAALLLPLAATPVLSQTAVPDGGDRYIAAVSIPAELETAVDEMLEAANNRDLDAVLSLYDEDFEHGDGLNLEEVSAAISNFWGAHPELDYQSTIESWEQVTDGYEATIVTDVTGIQESERGDFDLVASSTVLNRFEINEEGELLLVGQEVLKESSQLVSGENPPEVTVTMPTKVSVGSEFDVEAIVEEPWGTRCYWGQRSKNQLMPSLIQTALPSPYSPCKPGDCSGGLMPPIAPERSGFPSCWLAMAVFSLKVAVSTS